MSYWTGIVDTSRWSRSMRLSEAAEQMLFVFRARLFSEHRPILASQPLQRGLP